MSRRHFLNNYEPPVWFPSGDRVLTSHRVTKEETDTAGKKTKTESEEMITLDTAGAAPVTLPVAWGNVTPPWRPAGGFTDCYRRTDLSTRFDLRVTQDRIYYVDCSSTKFPRGLIPEPIDVIIASVKLDGTDRRTIVTRAGRILAVGDEGQVTIPAGATVVDGTGLTIIPGLIDVHEHASRWAPNFLDPDATDLLSFGVTSAFNPQTRLDADMQTTELQELGEVTAFPRVRHFYSGRNIGPGPTSVQGLNSARQAAAYLDALGAPVAKEYLQLSRQQRRDLVAALSERGIGITAHTSGLQRTLTLVADGYTAWEHFYMITPFFKDVTTFITASGINVTANITTNQMTSNPAGWSPSAAMKRRPSAPTGKCG